jgi:hypothetical protein
MNNHTSKKEASSSDYHHRILTDAELDSVAGGFAISEHGTTFTQVGLGLRKSAGNGASGVMF